MSIKALDILDAKARKYGANKESAQFQHNLVDAINYTLDDIQNRVGVDTTRITRINEVIDLDAQVYQACLSLGVDFYMQDNAEFTTQGLEGVEDRYKMKLRDVRHTYQVSQTIYGRLGDLS